MYTETPKFVKTNMWLGIRSQSLRRVEVTVTVTEALVLHPLLEDRGRITESIRILVPVDRMKQKQVQ